MKNMTILVPDPAEGAGLPRFRVSVPKEIDCVPEHFPPGFAADYPAVVTDVFARDILSVADEVKGPFQVFIDLREFVLADYPWIPFTLALHALALSPGCNVFFSGMDPMSFSGLIDARRPGRPLNCIRNFAAYLCTRTGDRPQRVYEQMSSSYVPFEHRIMGLFERPIHFAPYYLSWLQYSYRFLYDGRKRVVYSTHPFDHLPVRNRTEELKTGYLTRTQIKALTKKEPDIRDAVLMHDQIETVVLRPYWPKW